jgi:O-antigen/teichoic acid export membrane protein
MNQTLTRYLPAFVKKKLERNPHLHAVLSNTGWIAGDKIVRMAVGLLIGIWMARYLGPARYGQFSYALAFAFIFSPIAMLGLDEIVIRKLVREGDQVDPLAEGDGLPTSTKRDEILGTVFVLMLGGGLAVFALASAAIFLARPGDSLMHWLVGILTAGTIFQAFLAIEFFFESQLQWKLSVYAKASAFLIVSIVKVVLIVSQASLVAFAWASLAEIVLGSAGLVVVYQANGLRLAAWRCSRSMAVTLMKDSWPVVFSVFLTTIYLKIDQIMLGTLASDQELGLYSAAVRLTEAWNFIPMAICSSFFPTIMVLATTDEESFHYHVQKLYNLMALTAYAIAIPVALLSHWIVKLLLTDVYAKTGSLLSVLIWSVLFTNLSAARNVFMVSRNWLKINLVSTLLGCIVNILLNWLLIPVYGAMGAIAASLFSYWFAVHGTCFLFKSLRPTGWMLAKAMIYPKVW